MLGKWNDALWKLLTPDLVAAPPADAAVPASLLAPEVIAALGGSENLATQQRVAITRIRVQVRDQARIDEAALQACSLAGAMLLPDGLVHVLTPEDSPGP
ncbi:PTS transporter subunit EIIB [Stenotrophomonas rhizophila]|uniref:PTS transporter subunit EIIB n=1 Tax=Stenotrophomonas rhizophila TaxID=216778 RepID=UPI001E5DED3D|nr:PTS transporter subunit EIIB [Stenotrophomonas rhizophila]MCC7635111.1 PTS transporter subunit EIIB [Stenotrophomonas rhizophila]MCC7664873.1 PTS transporter subunit EIIB [Stenotrophomonas rhizophila]